MTELVAADPFHFPSPVAGGPGLLRWLPCELGPSGWCSNGRHDHCAHRWGGEQHDGVHSPEGYLTRRDGTVVAGTPLLPLHVWRCSCDCHNEAGATDLLGFIR